jgi:hypothetical protein
MSFFWNVVIVLALLILPPLAFVGALYFLDRLGKH